MRMIVTSDSHGRSGALFDIIEKHIDDAQLFVNLGDCNSGRDLEDAKAYFGNRLNLICVSGNCDFAGNAPVEQVITFGEKKVILCHGHTYSVKFGLYDYQSRAKREGADIALYGHTHTPCVNYIEGIYYFNPGAVRDGIYGIVDVTKAGIVCFNAKI